MVRYFRSLENGRLVKGETRLVGASRVFYVYLHRTPSERVVHRLKHTSQRVCADLNEHFFQPAPRRPKPPHCVCGDIRLLECRSFAHKRPF